jgi:hydroxymethylpyrimidine pyrophosphatase-like HAD family hydrolase
MNPISLANPPKVSLLLADVDGTLVTKEKILTDRARAAIHKLWDAGIRFTITSGRPPLGMKMIVDALKLTEPIAAFNGGLFVYPDFSMLEENVLPTTIVQDVIKIIAAHHLDVWLYRGKDWFVHERHGPHVDREEWTVKFPPTVVSSFDGLCITWSKLWALVMIWTLLLNVKQMCKRHLVHMFTVRQEPVRVEGNRCLRLDRSPIIWM